MGHSGHTAENSRHRSEPENQDRCGMGVRSAHASINFQIVIIFSTIQPVIVVVGALSFLVSRIVYGYVVVFAETPKHDIGGWFWAAQMTQIWQGLFIHIVLLAGVLKLKSGSWIPVVIVTPALLCLWYLAREFETRYTWKRLPLDEGVNCESRGEEYEPEFMEMHYRQPELLPEISGELQIDKSS